MIVIIEGADKVGKSTLARRFAVVHHLPVIKICWKHYAYAEVETRTMAHTTIEILRKTRPSAIFDRIYFSWWAYGPALGYRVAFMPEIIANFGEINDARLILLTASEDEIRQRFDREPDLFFPLDVILEANERYPSLLSLLPENLPRLHIDTTNLTSADVFAQAEAFIQSAI